MSQRPDPTATIRVAMSKGDRRAAVAVLRSGTRSVRLLGNWTALRTDCASWGQTNRHRGDIHTTWRNGAIRADRQPIKGDQYSPYFGGRSYPTTFEGEVTEDGTAIQGTAATDAKRYNRFALPGAIFVGLAVGAGIGYGEKNLVLGIVLAPIVFAFFWFSRGITRGREARILAKDLERIAATLAEGVAHFYPPTQESGAERSSEA